MNLVVTKKYARPEIYINRGDKETNKEIFDYFYKLKAKIEKDFGNKLVWEKMEDNVTSRIKYQLDDVNIFDEEDWPKMIEFLIDSSARMYKAFKEPIKKLKI